MDLIGHCRLTNCGLYHLMTCSWLQHLEITNTDLFTVDFDEGLAPVLAEVGPGLLTLKLDRFRHVDISLVGRLCPRLGTLSLSHIVHFPQLINISEVRGGDDIGNTFIFYRATSLSWRSLSWRINMEAVLSPTLSDNFYSTALTYSLSHCSWVKT